MMTAIRSSNVRTQGNRLTVEIHEKYVMTRERGAAILSVGLAPKFLLSGLTHDV